MKNLYIFTFAVLAACGEANTKTSNADATTTAAVFAEQPVQSLPTDTVVKQYEGCLKTLDASQINNVKAACLNYQWMFKSKDVTTCDSGYALFESFYNRVYDLANNNRPVISNNPKRLKEMKEALLSYGFEFAQQEGEWYYKQNRNFISEEFGRHVSPVMKQFIGLMQKESEKTYATEGGLNIPPQLFAQRFIEWNEFSRMYPDFILKTYSENYAVLYGSILIQGIENTPLLTGEPEHLNIFYTDAYDYLLEKYSHISYTAKFKEYKAALLAKDEYEVAAFQAKWLPYEVPR
jgi:hypothetical protein